MQHNYHVSPVILRPPTSSQSFKLQMNSCQDYLKHSQHLQNSCLPPQTRGKPLEEGGLQSLEKSRTAAQKNEPGFERQHQISEQQRIQLNLLPSSQECENHPSTPIRSSSNSFISYLRALEGNSYGESPWPRAQQQTCPCKDSDFQEHCSARSSTGLGAPPAIISLALPAPSWFHLHLSRFLRSSSSKEGRNREGLKGIIL